MEPTIYDEAITEIVNTIHECSRITEGIEGKVALISDDSEIPKEPEDPSKVDEGRPLRGTTPLARRLDEIFEYAEKLRQRLKKAEDIIIIEGR